MGAMIAIAIRQVAIFLGPVPFAIFPWRFGL